MYAAQVPTLFLKHNSNFYRSEILSLKRVLVVHLLQNGQNFRWKPEIPLRSGNGEKWSEHCTKRSKMSITLWKKRKVLF